MTTPQERDEVLWQAIETGHLGDSSAIDREVARGFAVYRKLDSLFALLRDPAPSAGADDALESASA
jgi:hypothetical protein